MRRILLIFKNDVKRRLKSPYAVLVLLLIPIVMTALMGAIFSPSENKLPKIKVLMVDNDKNIGSRLLLGAFDSPQMAEMFQLTVVNEDEGKKLIGKGKASALVIIPEEFTERIVKAEPSQFLVIKNPSEQFLPSVVEEFMNTFAVVVSGFVQVFEDEIKAVDALVNTPLENISITDMTPFMEKSRQKIVALRGYLDPLLIELKEEIVQKKKKQSRISVFTYLLPAISFMFMLFIIEIFIRDILNEREDGKLQRIMFSPTSSLDYITARIFSGWIMGIAAFLVVVLVGILLFGIDWGNYLYLFFFGIVSCFWISGFFALLNAFFKNKNQAGAVSAPVVLAFSAFGGSFVPVSQLPKGFSQISFISPNYWFIEGVNKIINGEFPMTSFLVLALSGIILFVAAVRFLNKRITI